MTWFKQVFCMHPLTKREEWPLATYSRCLLCGELRRVDA